MENDRFKRLYANSYRDYLLLFFNPETINLINSMYCYQLVEGTCRYILMVSDMYGNWRKSTLWDSNKQRYVELDITFSEEQIKSLFYKECYRYEN